MGVSLTEIVYRGGKVSSIKATVTGDTEILLRRLASMRTVDTKGAMRAIAEGLRTSTVERFDKSVSPDGKKWKTSIRAGNAGGKTLLKTANLRTSIRSEADRTGMAVGTNSIYAATHQFGDARIIKPKRKKVLKFQINGKWITKSMVKVRIPARPFLGISEDDEEEIREVLDDLLKG